MKNNLMSLFLPKFTIWGLTFFGALAASGCQAQNQHSQDPGGTETQLKTRIYFDGKALNFDGPITIESAKKFSEISKSIKPGTILRIRSDGGAFGPSLDIANIITENNMDIRVSNYCLSTCTNLFLAANKKIVDKNSIVAFRFFYSSFEDLIFNSIMYSGQKISNNFNNKEKELFMKKNISLDIIQKSDDILDVICLGVYPSNKVLDDIEKIPALSRHTGWVLSLYQMRLLGIKNITGYWPEDQIEVDFIVNQYVKPNADQYIKQYISPRTTVGIDIRYIRDLSSITDKTPKLPPCKIP